MSELHQGEADDLAIPTMQVSDELAEFFDRRGFVNILSHKRKSIEGGESYSLDVRLIEPESERARLEEFRTAFGGFIHPLRSETGGDSLQWSIQGARAGDFINLVRPHCPRLAARLDLAAQFEAVRRASFRKSGSQLSRMKELRQQMKHIKPLVLEGEVDRVTLNERLGERLREITGLDAADTWTPPPERLSDILIGLATRAEALEAAAEQGEKDAEIARLTAENSELRARLAKLDRLREIMREL